MPNPPDNSWNIPQSQPNLPAVMPTNPTLATGSTLVNPYKWPMQAASGLPAGAGPKPPPTPTVYPWGQ